MDVPRPPKANFSLWNCRRHVNGNKGVGLPRGYISSPFIRFITTLNCMECTSRNALPSLLKIHSTVSECVTSPNTPGWEVNV